MEGDFSGAFNGATEVTYRYAKGAWQVVDDPFPNIGSLKRNVELGAVGGRDTIAVNTDFRNSPNGVDFVAASNDPMIGSRQWTLIGRPKSAPVGYGVVTDINRDEAVGYVSNPYYHGGAITAERWSRREVQKLGPGLAYSIDTDGRIVGDDRPTLMSEGRPIVWSGTTPTRLGDAFGSALMIREDRIVGYRARKAFLARVDGKGISVESLATSLPRAGESAAFDISNDGSILVMVLGTREEPYRYLLRPMKPEQKPVKK